MNTTSQPPNIMTQPDRTSELVNLSFDLIRVKLADKDRKMHQTIRRWLAWVSD